MALTALVTGASRGIGFATAELFAMHGWNVVLCSRNEAQANSAAKKITQTTGNPNVIATAADTGNAKDIERLFALADSHFPTLDALVNNAAVLNIGSVFDLTDEGFEETMHINVEGVMRCARQAFQRMKKSGGGIVNISSLAGIQGTDKLSGLWAYTTSKFAVVGLTEGLAVEGKPYNIRVNCVAPGATDTDMLRKAAPDFKARAVPADIAKIVYYLCDPAQSGIVTGTTVPVFSNS